VSRRYQVKNTDDNEKDIVSALREIPGCEVETDKDDILVGYKKRTYWFEIKNPAEVDKHGKPYKRDNKTYRKQKKLNDTWAGHYEIVTSLDQILIAIGVIK